MIRQTGGLACRRHLDEVEIELAGDGECLGQRLDAELRAVGSDEADLAGSDAVVDPRLVGRRRGYCCSLRGKGLSSRVANRALEKARRPRTGSPPNATMRWRGCPGALRSTTARRLIAGSGGRVGRCTVDMTRQHGPLSEFSCAVRVTHVSSLWTPGGEHPVDPEPEAHPGADLSDDLADDLDDDLPDDLPDAEMRAEIDEVRRQLAQVPPEVVVANHVMGLYELAAIHLSQDPPNAAGAALAIDGMGALVEGLAGRLGEAEPTLRDALSQMRLVFVQVTGLRG